MTITGGGGTGKSVVINTLVTLFRRMFNCNDVIRIAAPTGTAAFNVNGETFHHMLGNKISHKEYQSGSMSSSKRAKLVEKFKLLLALIIDERSLVQSVDFGTCKQMISETIYGPGYINDASWGGLPILIVVGDDYQLVRKSYLIFQGYPCISYLTSITSKATR